ncbi:MAG TPA: twin-arginine translocase subunit TatC, partial [Candidatus Aquicultoraceae bacterium]|nr:twin-arginine translocase subunit TatC [Candidatus Aquicultoraceae bacterium]
MENRFLGILAEAEKARKGLGVYAACVLVLSAVSFFCAETVLGILVRLLDRKLVAFDPSEGFFAILSIALYCGVALSLPVAAWMIWRGTATRSRPQWRRWGWVVIGAACALFSAGILLGYYVLLPAGIGFLVGFETQEVRALLSARKFVSFCGTMLLAMGLSFE